MTSQQRRLLVLSLLPLPLLDLCASTAAEATTIRPPKDLGHLARMSRAVVLARASTHSVEDPGLPIPLTSLEPEPARGDGGVDRRRAKLQGGAQLPPLSGALAARPLAAADAGVRPVRGV